MLAYSKCLTIAATRKVLAEVAESIQFSFPLALPLIVHHTLQMLAKLSCGLHKPNQQTLLSQSAVPLLFSTMPVHKM